MNSTGTVFHSQLYSPSEILEFDDNIDDYLHGQDPVEGTLAMSPPTAAAQGCAVMFQDILADQMWADYQQYQAEHSGEGML